jgi:hypothetical protein
MLHGVVQICRGDEPLQIHYGGTDPHRAALVILHGDRGNVLGRPAEPVAGFPSVGRIGADGLVHSQKIGDRLFVIRRHWP